MAAWKNEHFFIQLIYESAFSFAAFVNLAYELSVLPNALMTSIPSMYSTAASFSALVFSTVLL